jgi:hypothetical protein
MDNSTDAMYQEPQFSMKTLVTHKKHPLVIITHGFNIIDNDILSWAPFTQKKGHSSSTWALCQGRELNTNGGAIKWSRYPISCLNNCKSLRMPSPRLSRIRLPISMQTADTISISHLSIFPISPFALSHSLFSSFLLWRLGHLSFGSSDWAIEG